MNNHINHPTLITTWHCKCNRYLPISIRTCPYCKNNISQDSKASIYQQVLAELRQDALDASGQRWQKYGTFSLKVRIALRITMFLLAAAWLVLMLIYRLDFFTPLWAQISDPCKQIFTETTGGFAEVIPPVIAKLSELPIQPLVEPVGELFSFCFQWVGLLFSRFSGLLHLIISFFH